MDRDFFIARAAAARSKAALIIDFLDDLISQVVDPEEGSRSDKVYNEIAESVEIILNESGTLSRCIEVMESCLEELDRPAFTAGEPNYDDIIDDGGTDADDADAA